MSIQYRGDDGRIHSLGDNDSLQHWKYIKKIPVGNGFRYFYSQEEIRAYEEAKKSADRSLSDDSPAILYGHRRGKEKEYKRIADEAKKNSFKRFKKDVKDTWDYAKPQKPSTMNKRVEKEYSRNTENRAKRAEDINKRYEKLGNSKNSVEEGGRISAREEYYDRLNNKERNEYNKHVRSSIRYKNTTKKISDIKNSGSKTIEKGRSKVEKKLNKARKKKTTKGDDLDGFKIMDSYGRGSIRKKKSRR